MKDFKKLIREAYLGNPLNESVTPFTRVHYIASPAPRKMLVQDLKNLFGDDLETVTNFMDDGGYESVLVFNLRDSDIERIEDEIGDVITGEYSLKKVKEIQEALDDSNERLEQFYEEKSKHFRKIIRLSCKEIIKNVQESDAELLKNLYREMNLILFNNK